MAIGSHREYVSRFGELVASELAALNFSNFPFIRAEKAVVVSEPG